MQTLIVVLIILAAAVYVGRRFYRSTQAKSSCGCGCDGCGAASDCADIQSQTAGEIADEMARRENRS